MSDTLQCVLWANQAAAQCCSVDTAQACPHSALHSTIYYPFISLSLSTAPGVASVNSACRCVDLPNGGTLCDPVGCELVHVKHCPTMIQFSAYCTIGDTEYVEEQKLDKGNSYSRYSSNCWSGSL